MSSEREAFEQAIAANPADDTVRLVYADWLDEHGFANDACEQRLAVHLRHIIANPSDDVPRLAYADVCSHYCRNDRAELIRVQCELSSIKKTKEWFRECFYDGHGSCGCVVCEFQSRSFMLKDANPDWERLKCSECKGRGDIPRDQVSGKRSARLVCAVCYGVGDLLYRPNVDLPTGAQVYDRNPQFARGFVDGVSCTLAELGEELDGVCPHESHYPLLNDGLWHSSRWCGQCNGSGRVTSFVPSPWAVAIVRALPVTRFRITDKSPMENPWLVTNGISYQWVTRSLSIELDRIYNIPDWMWTDNLAGPFLDRESAIDALSLAAGNLVRQSVYGNQAAS